MKIWRAIVTLTVISFLLGCESEQKAMYERYSTRLGNVLDISLGDMPDTEAVTLEDTRDLLRSPTAITIGLLDSYSLRKCGLFQLIADKNSILGKVADPFREFDYQVQFIQQAQRCIEDDSIDIDVAQALQSALVTKQNELIDVYLSNVLWTSQAMRTQLSASDWLTEADFHHSAATITALKHFNTTLADTHHQRWQAIKPIQPEQETLEKQPIVGPLIFSLHNSTVMLNHINRHLQQHFPHVSCGENRDNTQFRYLTNVLNQQYIDVIQIYSAELNQVFYQVSLHIDFLTEDVMPQVIDLMHYHQKFHEANLQHVQLWQSLSKRCGALTQ
ncbi:DUF3080 family protein [Vibrio agarivorans]|uniref:DUF3080 family protein n=1 Tax=Vibrio agarivorans TaxID=153622 RepID=UPI0025B42E04|nr:DUF3080 family protein [Vibrio agarivorans]MDN3663271.1 DUF3080 family protein [Vibrio agarivorans]